jgi:predicted acylesterase/phospholipase RssA
MAEPVADTTVRVRGAQPEREKCDLIMKGGITSGVAYPAAVMRLSERYDFVAIGGSSAGAIAAAVTAAAQFARDRGGFARLDGVRGELQEPDLVPRLFQATKETRPLLDLMLAAQSASTSWQKVRVFVGRVLGRLALPVALWLSGGFAALALLLGRAGATWSSFTWLAYVMLGLLLLLFFGVALVGLIAARLSRAVTTYLPTSNYGMCLGLSEQMGDQPPAALTEWLHQKIQHVAGMDGGEPLTFRTLQDEDVRLLMTTTNLTWSRPVRLPCGDQTYYLDVDEFRALFPGPVVDHLVAWGHKRARTFPTPEGDRTLLPLPGLDLPVIVATRMSLSFPVLLAAVPLWAEDPDGTARRHWFSDGGISSNFPIHLFDAWVPTRPTFGLDLVQIDRDNPSRDARDYVKTYMDRPPQPTTVPIRSLVGFLRQILATMQNWHDTLQSELTGFHDRIAHIELSSKEGGLNITMPREVIAFIDKKGAEAGQGLCDGFTWEKHQARRYEIFMGMLQDGLSPRPAGDAGQMRTVHDAWHAGLADRIAGYAQQPPDNGKPAAWYAAAGPATTRLLGDAGQWLCDLAQADADEGATPAGNGATRLTFRPDQPLVPPACMRISPDV